MPEGGIYHPIFMSSRQTAKSSVEEDIICIDRKDGLGWFQESRAAWITSPRDKISPLSTSSTDRVNSASIADKRAHTPRKLDELKFNLAKYPCNNIPKKKKFMNSSLPEAKHSLKLISSVYSNNKSYSTTEKYSSQEGSKKMQEKSTSTDEVDKNIAKEEEVNKGFNKGWGMNDFGEVCKNAEKSIQLKSEGHDHTKILSLINNSALETEKSKGITRAVVELNTTSTKHNTAVVKISNGRVNHECGAQNVMGSQSGMKDSSLAIRGRSDDSEGGTEKNNKIHSETCQATEYSSNQVSYESTLCNEKLNFVNNSNQKQNSGVSKNNDLGQKLEKGSLGVETKLPTVSGHGHSQIYEDLKASESDFNSKDFNVLQNRELKNSPRQETKRYYCRNVKKNREKVIQYIQNLEKNRTIKLSTTTPITTNNKIEDQIEKTNLKNNRFVKKTRHNTFHDSRRKNSEMKNAIISIFAERVRMDPKLSSKLLIEDMEIVIGLSMDRISTVLRKFETCKSKNIPVQLASILDPIIATKIGNRQILLCAEHEDQNNTIGSLSDENKEVCDSELNSAEDYQTCCSLLSKYSSCASEESPFVNHGDVESFDDECSTFVPFSANASSDDDCSSSFTSNSSSTSYSSSSLISEDNFEIITPSSSEQEYINHSDIDDIFELFKKLPEMD